MGFMDWISSAGDLIGKGVQGLMQDLPATAMQFGLGQLTANLGGQMSARQSAEAFERSQGAYGTRYQTTMQDMRKAGLNPILAASGGFGVGNAPQMAAPQAFQAPAPVVLPSSASAKNVAEQTNIEYDTLKKREEIKNIIEDTNVKLEEQVNIFEDTIKKRKEQNLLEAQELKSYQETVNLVQDFQIKIKILAKTAEEIRLVKAQTAQSGAATAELRALEKQAQAKTDELRQIERELRATNERLEKSTDIYKRPMGTIWGAIRGSLEMLGIGRGK